MARSKLDLTGYTAQNVHSTKIVSNMDFFETLSIRLELSSSRLENDSKPEVALNPAASEKEY